jgi:hypothetical protein
MDVYVAVVSHHGEPEELKAFLNEAAARHFAVELAAAEGWENEKEHDHHHHDHDDADHTHAPADEWLEEWGDDDGCGVVVGKATPA